MSELETIHATDDLIVEMWRFGGTGNKPYLAIRTLDTLPEDTQCAVIYLDEVSALIEALAEAASTLAEMEVMQCDE